MANGTGDTAIAHCKCRKRFSLPASHWLAGQSKRNVRDQMQIFQLNPLSQNDTTQADVQWGAGVFELCSQRKRLRKSREKGLTDPT